MKDISNQKIADILREYAVQTEPNSSLVEGIRSYISLLLRWNKSISLTTITDPQDIVRFHFGESFFAASCVPIANGRLADIGSGAGFPGLPLKMLIPEIDLTLIESNAKKAVFLGEVVRKLALDHVRIFRGRMEEFDRPTDGPEFDFVTARALGQFDKLLAWVRLRLSKSGKLILWLGEEDIRTLLKAKKWYWYTPTRIPGSNRRFILSGSPQE